MWCDVVVVAVRQWRYLGANGPDCMDERAGGLDGVDGRQRRLQSLTSFDGLDSHGRTEAD